MIFVAGMPSGGTSMVSGILDAFGVDMGEIMDRRTTDIMATRRNYQTFECLEWANEITNFRALNPAATLDMQAQVFVNYVRRRIQNAPKGVPQGVKQPMIETIGLNYRLDQIPLSVVHIHRDLEDCFRSRRAKEGINQNDMMDMGLIWLGLDVLIQRVPPVVSLEYEDVRSDPARAATQIAKALDLPSDRIAKAAATVTPQETR